MIAVAQSEPNTYVELLRTFDYDVVRFDRPVQCVAQCLKKCPRLIVMDLCGMDQSAGLWLASELTRLRLDIPIVMLNDRSRLSLKLEPFSNVIVIEPERISTFIDTVEELAGGQHNPDAS